MNKLLAVLAVLAVAAWAMPAQALDLGATDYFKVTADGSFNMHASEGYSNAGGKSMPRVFKGRENYGWLSFDGAVGASSNASMAAFVAAHADGDWSKVAVKLHFATDSLLPVAGTGTYPVGAYLESLRSGNQGALVSGTGSAGAGQYNLNAGWGEEPDAVVGCSEPVAFIMANQPFNDPTNNNVGYANKGDLIATAWVAPAGRASGVTAQGNTDPLAGPGQNIAYTGGGVPSPTGTRGWYPGGNLWALQDLLGGFYNNGQLQMDPTATSRYFWTKSGQILAGGQGTETVVNETNFPAGAANDPWHGGVTGNWYGIPLDTAFAQDQATGAQTKGLVFNNYNNRVTASSGNQGLFSLDQSGGAAAAYLSFVVVPEPATLALLALGGLALLRRRS